jgi:two-component system, OmpR family, sensor histidine kinase KdpD
LLQVLTAAFNAFFKPMSIRRSALQVADLEDRPQAQPGVGPAAPAVATKYFDLARIWVRKAMAPGGVTGVVMALVFIVGTDALLLFMRYIQELPPVGLTFLLPVVVAALRWGTLSAAITAIGGAVTLSFFFFNPFYVTGPSGRSAVLGLIAFLIVSLLLGYLAAKTRRDAALALKRENENRDLYLFSQRISAANSPAGIFEAMQQHLETLVGRKVLLFDSRGSLEAKSDRLGDVEIPQAVTKAVSKMPAAGNAGSKDVVVDDHHGSAWLVSRVSTDTADFGVIAVDLGRPSEEFDELRARVVALIGDAALSLERLGLARTISEARTREDTERFREALISSVSHELRTPLSSILGASTVLSLAPAVTGDARLKELAALIHQESERLNLEIQNILDASRISSNSLQAKREWAEPADFINAALLRCRNRLTNRAVEVTLPEELVLLRIDSVLMEQALGQILDNAAKYSPPESPINVHGDLESGQFVISIADQGAGLDPEDRTLLGQKFFRGSRHMQVTSGLGLGFWLASAFIAANNGTIEATSEGVNKGMTVTVRLPLLMHESEATSSG